MRPHRHVRQSRAFRGLATAAIAAALFGAAVGLARRVEAPPVTPLFACWSTHLKTALVPDNLAAHNDRDAIDAGDYFPINTFHLGRGLSADLLRSELERSIEVPGEHRAVYLSAYATRGAGGDLILMTQEFDPLTARGGLPISDVLSLLDRDGRPTLLVLDLAWKLTNGQAGLLPCGVGKDLIERLKSNPGAERLTLLSCSPGEAATRIAGVSRTTFGYFFEAGLNGAADGFNPGATTDARVSARELSTYVADRVACWTRRHGPSPQTPLLISNEAIDFPVSGCREGTPSLRGEPLTEYPDWLLEAWQVHKAWREGPLLESLPRLVRRHGVALMGIERRWAAGFDEGLLRDELGASTGPIRQEYNEAVARVAERPVVSTQRLDPGEEPEDGLVKAWLLRIDSSLTAEEPAARAAFAEAIAGATGESLVSAGMTAVLRSEAKFRRALLATADELSDRAPEGQYLERVALARLAALAREQPDLNGGLLRSFLETAVLREQAWSYSSASDWDRQRLDEAELSCSSAWDLLAAPGYAATDDALGLNATAHRQFLAIVEAQAVIRDASRICQEAMAVLPDALPLLKSYPLLHDDWLDATETAGRLRTQLGSRQDRIDRPTTSVGAIDATACELRRLLTQIKQPLKRDATGRLASSLREGNHAAAVAAEHLLETPLLSAEQRAELRLALDAIAGEVQTSLSAFTSDTRRGTILAAVRGDNQRVSIESNRVAAEAAALAESERLASLLRLVGVDVESIDRPTATDGDVPPSDFARLSQVRAAISETLNALDADAELQTLINASQVLPARRFSAVLDARLRAPTYVAEAQRYERWRRHASDRLQMQSEGSHGSAMLVEVARRLGSDPLPPLQLDRGSSPGHSLAIDLSERRPVGRIKLRLRHDPEQPIHVTVWQPADCLSSEVEKKSTVAGSEIHLTLRLKPGATPTAQASTQGVLLSVRQGLRTRHYRIDTPGLAGVVPVQLFAEMAGIRQPVDERLDLPPQVKPTPLRLIAVNRTNRPQSFDAGIVAGGTYRASLALGPLEEAPLRLTLAPAPEGQVPPPSNAAPVERLSIQLRDSTSGKLLLEQGAELGVADPSVYVRVRDARVDRGRDGRTIATLQLERLPGSADPVDVVWSLAASRAAESSTVAGGALAATLTEPSPVATLRATLTPETDAGPLTATAEVNGVPSAIRWRGRLPAFGQSAALRVDRTPTIEVEADELVASGDPLSYTVRAIPAGKGARLEVGFAGTGTTTDRFEVLHRFKRVRREIATVQPKPAAGDLLLSTTIGQWVGEIDTRGMAGRRMLVAQVRDSDGVILARATQPVVVDADPPERLALEPKDDAVVNGKPLSLVVTALDRLSGIEGVRVYLGEPTGSAPPPGAKPVAAVRESTGAGRWIAAAPIPKGVTSIAVTAEVTNGVGLVRCLTRTLAVQSAEQVSLGSVAGSVVEGARPQPGLAVELRDADQKPIAAAKTNASGRFLFPAVKPGKYLVWAVKTQSQRVGASAVEVKSGATSQADVSLSL